MSALIAAVFLASVLGSLHCAGMCGAFLAFAVAADGRPGPVSIRRRAALNAAYNLGRLTTYMALGAAGGILGAAVDLGGGLIGLQRSAAIVAGVMMIGFGVTAVLRQRGVRVPHPPVPPGLRALVMRGHRTAAAWPPLARSAAVGMLTTLLPCGWLYAFAITAAGTASPWLGAATMAAFWAGTLPVMVSLGVGLQSLSGPLRRRVPMLTSLALVVVGISTVAGRLAMPAMATGQAGERPPSGVAGSVARVQSLDSSTLPCCRGERPHD